jgi:hypothetical protein
MGFKMIKKVIRNPNMVMPIVWHGPADYQIIVKGKLGDQWSDWFAGTVKKAQSQYREYVKKGVLQGKRSELSGGGLVCSAGGWSAVKMLRKSLHMVFIY